MYVINIKHAPIASPIKANNIPKTIIATEMTITKKVMQNYIENGIVDDWKTYTTAIAHYITTTYKLQSEEEDNSNKKFVLIIDEIKGRKIA